jgi:hypothetical protein
MWAVMACDNSGVVDGSSLRHVLVVGGSLDQWKSMTVAEWSEYITTLKSSVEKLVLVGSACIHILVLEIQATTVNL